MKCPRQSSGEVSIATLSYRKKLFVLAPNIGGNE